MTHTLDAVEKMRRMADALPDKRGQFFIQRDEHGKWGAGVGLAYDTALDVRDVDSLDEAIDGVARLIISACWRRLNEWQIEDKEIRGTLGALLRLGYT